MKRIIEISSKNSCLIGMAFLWVSFAPYIILGEDAFITIHDHLDLSTAHIRMLMDHGAMFDYSKNLPIGDGISRSYFFVPFDLRLLFYYIFPTYWAIFANNVLVRIIGYIGMYLLLDKYVIKEKTAFTQLVKIVLALGFSLSCAYTDYSLSALGFPLIFYVFLNFKENRCVMLSYFLMILYCFYNHFELGGFFACCVIGFYIIYLIFKERSFPWRVAVPLMIMSLLFLIQYYPMIDNFFSATGESSNREDFYSTYTVGSALKDTLSIMAKSMYHVGMIFALPSFVTLLYILFKSNHKERNTSLLYLLGYVSIGSIIMITRLLHNIQGLTIVQSFQFDRFYWIYPTLVCVSCAYSCFWLFKANNLYKVLAFFLLFITSISSVLWNVELRKNSMKLFSKNTNDNSPSFEAFFDTDLFNHIKSDCNIVEWETKAICIGMFPSVAQYNRISTLDFYQSNYPLAYKYKFRNIISKELKKNEELKNYFDNWGNRCYIFSSELGKQFLYGKESGKSIKALEINTKALQDLGCQYVFSAAPIENYKDINLTFINAYTTPESYWKIWVYMV